MINKYTDNDLLEESISSVFDGTASSGDIAKILSAYEKDWQQKLDAYAFASAIVKGDTHPSGSDSIGSSLLDRINDEIDEITTHNDTAETSVVQLQPVNKINEDVRDDGQVVTPLWKKSFGSLALAASVAFVVISGGSYILDGTSQPRVQQQASIAQLPTVVDLQPLQHVSVVVENKRLQSYLRQHAEQSTMAAGQGMLPMARVVAYPIGQE